MDELAQLLAKVPVVLSVFLVVLGKVLKSIPAVDNQWIPLAVIGAGTILHPLMQKVWDDPTVWMMGFVAGAGAVGIHQLAVQTKQGVKEEVQEHKAEKAAEKETTV